jgi:CheY-like chemotaxis protein
MAAVEAILKLEPSHSFPGSSYVPEALGYFATSAGARKAIVGHPRLEVAQALASQLIQLGYEAEPVSTGRAVLLQAAASADIELILISGGMDFPISKILLQELRHDKRTGKLPIGLLASLNELDHAQAMAAGDPLTEAFPEPRNAAGMKILVERLLTRAGTGAVLPPERQQQAARAMAYLATLSSTAQKLYDLRRQEQAVQAALYMPPLTLPATVVLGNLGTATSQRALVDLASRAGLPIAARRAAEAAFGQSVSRYGLRLTSDEILRQYDRYNQSAVADADTQAVLAAVLDWIEIPSKTRTDER